MSHYVLCPDDPDWDWWLKLEPEVRGYAVKWFRRATDGFYPAFLTSSSAKITVNGDASN